MESSSPSAAQDRELVVSKGKLEHALGRRLDARAVRAILAEIDPREVAGTDSAASSYDLARMQAEHDLTQLPLRKRLRVYLGGVYRWSVWTDCTWIVLFGRWTFRVR